MPGLVIETASDLQVSLNTLLQEHVYLLVAASDATINQRQDVLQSAQDALDQNSEDISSIIGMAYGDDAQSEFRALWDEHIEYHLAYAEAAATANQDQKTEAMTNMEAFADEFGALIAGALSGGGTPGTGTPSAGSPTPGTPQATGTPGAGGGDELSQEVLAGLMMGHISTMNAVMDAQAQQSDEVYSLVIDAARHMQSIADPLSMAIAEQFPDLFPAEAEGGAS
jgi:hypothetical protein